MSQSSRQQKPLDTGIVQNRRTQTQSAHITPLNIMIGFVAALILLFLVMSVLNIGPFSWGN